MTATKQSLLVSVCALAAAVALGASTLAPLWWVSLTAPNYPKDAFPDGIKIQFSFAGVSNGCTTMPKTSMHGQEIQQEDLGWRSPDGAAPVASAEKPAVIDCVNEMNTINHYVGMHPIGVGAPVERLMAPYILAMFAVMLVGFAVPVIRVRVGVLAAGFIGISGWMLGTLYGGKLAAFVAQYKDDAGKYFRDVDRIASWGESLTHWIAGACVVLVLAMVVAVFGSWRWPRFQLVLAAVPALMPVFFVGAYAGWLYYFGHNLHPWGAFTVKPFMPTVFGDGKVAQFTTQSYPTPFFAVLAASSVLSLVALVRRRLEFAPESAAAAPAASSPPPVVAEQGK